MWNLDSSSSSSDARKSPTHVAGCGSESSDGELDKGEANSPIDGGLASEQDEEMEETVKEGSDLKVVLEGAPSLEPPPDLVDDDGEDDTPPPRKLRRVLSDHAGRALFEFTRKGLRRVPEFKFTKVVGAEWWQEHIHTATSGFRMALPAQTRPLQVHSICTGLGTEFQAMEALQHCIM
jgi:hypothetical protein